MELKKAILCALTISLGMGTGGAATAGRSRHASTPSDVQFRDVRVQTSKNNGSPRVSRVRSGQKFWFGFYAEFTRPSKDQPKFSYVLSGKSGLCCTGEYPVKISGCYGSLYCQPGTFTLTLGPKQDFGEFSMVVALFANGKCITRTTRFEVYR